MYKTINLWTICNFNVIFINMRLHYLLLDLVHCQIYEQPPANYEFVCYLCFNGFEEW